MEVIPIDIGAVLSGKSDADFLLADRDSLYVYSVDEVQWEKYVYIEGEVKNPGMYPLYDRMSAEDLIFLAGSFTRGAYRHCIEIARIDSLGEVSIRQVEVGGDGVGSIALQEDDHIYVRQLPEWQLHRAVTIGSGSRDGAWRRQGRHAGGWRLHPLAAPRGSRGNR